jgi:hypothetical protein
MRTHRSLVHAASLVWAGTLAAQSVCAPTQRALADFGFGLACANCVIDSRAPVWIVFHLPPGLHDIRPGGPASAKIVQDDTLLAIDGMDITSRSGSERFSMARPGDSLALTVRRKGALLTTTIVAGTMWTGHRAVA